MGKQEYLSAGRFAALVGTTKETLFHYDEIGLFVPKRRGTNGYRYYAMDQMETFDVIGMLRELGMPLAEIPDRRGKVAAARHTHRGDAAPDLRALRRVQRAAAQAAREHLHHGHGRDRPGLSC